MYSRKIIKTALIGALISFSNLSNATIISGWGAEANSSTASNCPSFCTGDFEFASDGGLGASTASTDLSNTSGDSRAQSTLSGTSFTPILKAYADANAGSGAQATATGVQGYTYTGAAKEITLDLNLDSIITGDANVSGQVAVIFTDELDFFTDFGTVAFEVAPPGSVVASSQLFDNDIDTLTFNVNPGDDFFVWAGLQASGLRGGTADAFNTFTMSFDDDIGLLAASTASATVPVPATLWLFILGFGFLIRFVKRK